MPVGTRVALTPSIRVDGVAMSDEFMDAMTSMTVRLSVHTANSATLEFDDPHLTRFEATTLEVGKEVEVKIPAGSSMTTVFKGKVTAKGSEATYDDGVVGIPRLVVTAHDGSQAFATSATFQAYLSGARDVVTAIAQRHGLTAEIEGAPAVSDYILQAGTDHAMLTELARRSGYEWFADGTKLHFRRRPASGGPTLKRSDDTLLALSVGYSGAAAPTTLKVHGWDAGGAAAHVGQATEVISGTSADLGSSAAFVSNQYRKAKTSFGKDLNVGDPASRDATEADATAQGMARELVGRGLRAQGVAPCNPAIVAGGYVTIEGMSTSLDGDYYVTEVEHDFGPSTGLITRFSCGGHQPEPAPWDPGFGGATWAGRGPVVGIVTNVNDQENLGRVKVKFPSLGDVESEWARVAAPGAGATRGLDFRPEVNDEVLVAFERGDPRFPIVLGGLWNGNAALPRTDLVSDGVVKARVIQSRKGHWFEFSDGDGAEAFATVQLSNGTVLKLSEETGVLLEVVSGDLELKTAGGSIKLTESGDLTVDVQGAVTIKAIKAIKFDGKDAFEVKAVSGAKVDGGAKFEAKGATGKVDGGGVLELKGGMVKIN